MSAIEELLRVSGLYAKNIHVLRLHISSDDGSRLLHLLGHSSGGGVGSYRYVDRDGDLVNVDYKGCVSPEDVRAELRWLSMGETP